MLGDGYTPTRWTDDIVKVEFLGSGWRKTDMYGEQYMDIDLLDSSVRLLAEMMMDIRNLACRGDCKRSQTIIHWWPRLGKRTRIGERREGKWNIWVDEINSVGKNWFRLV